MDPITAILTAISGIENIAQALGDLAQKESFTDDQKADIQSRLDASRTRLDEIYAKAEADPE